MKIHSSLPFPNLFFRHWHHDGSEIGVVVVRASFWIRHGERPSYLDPQPEMLMSDVFHGEANVTSLKQESELAPCKMKTDVTFNAVARSPEAKTLQEWPVRFDVIRQGKTGREVLRSLAFHVTGERHWEPQKTAEGKSRQWSLSPIRPVKSVQLRYELTYGGTVKTGDETEETNKYNPVGRGILNDYLLEKDERRPAPQIGLMAEFAAMKPGEPMTVVGCGPVTKSWLPRLSLAGTFDEAWKNERHPRMPADYRYDFWNAAPQGLQISPWLSGDEIIEAYGVRHEPGPYRIVLPGGGLSIRMPRKDGGEPFEGGLRLDTVHCDIADENPANHVMSCVWRGLLRDPDAFDHIEIHPRSLS